MRASPLVFVALSSMTCTVWNDLDVCDRAAPVPSKVNNRTEGAQSVASPYAVTPLATGEAFVAFVSQATALSPALEVRGTRLDASGKPLRDCDVLVAAERTIAGVDLTNPVIDFNNFPAVATPAVPSRAGIVTWLRKRGDAPDELLATLLAANGCFYPADSAPGAVLAVHEAAAGQALDGPIPIALGGANDDFVIVWRQVGVSAGLPSHAAYAVALRWNGLRLAPLATTRSPAGAPADLGVPSRFIIDLAATRIDASLFAVAWHQTGAGRVGSTFLAIYDEQLTQVVPPTLVQEDEDKEGLAVRTKAVRIAFDGTHLLVVGTRGAGGSVKLWGRVFDRQGRDQTPERPFAEPMLLTGEPGVESMPAIAARAGAGFVVVYRRDADGVTNDSGAGLRALVLATTAGRAFNIPACGEGSFAIGTPGAGSRNPAITQLTSGGWLVVWSEDLTAGDTDVRSMVFEPKQLLPLP